MGSSAGAGIGRTAVRGNRRVGRYELLAPLASGGMATVYLAQRVGPGGFSRVFAAKRLHEHLSEDPEFVTMFMDEARIGARIHHPNVVPVVDVARSGDDAVLVLEYVHGVSLDVLFAQVFELMGSFPVPMAVAILTGILAGLQAAHTATDDHGKSLDLVHRDVSPQNVIVSAEGVPRLIDFGIAKATSSSHVTRAGFFKGKLAYMAPEQLRPGRVTRAADIYAAGVLLWEMLVGRRLFEQRDKSQALKGAVQPVPLPSEVLASEQGLVSEARRRQLELLDPIVARAVHPSPEERFASADEMIVALLSVARSVGSLDLGAWLHEVAGTQLAERRDALAAAQGSALHQRESFGELELSPESARLPTEQVAHAHGRTVAPPPPRSRSSRMLGAALLLLAGSLLTLACVVVLGRATLARDHAPGTTSAAAAPPSALAALPEAAAVVRSPDPAPLVASPPPTGQLVATPPVAHDVARPRGARSFVTAPRRIEPPAPANASAASATPPVNAASPSPCEVPYYMVGSRKVFKEECL